MSSILRALKKLEKDAGTSVGQAPGPGMSAVRRQQEKTALRKYLIIISVLVLLAVGSILLIKKPVQSPSAILHQAFRASASGTQNNEASASQASVGSSTPSREAQAGKKKGMPTPLIPVQESSADGSATNRLAPQSGPFREGHDMQKEKAAVGSESIPGSTAASNTAARDSDEPGIDNPAESVDAKMISSPQQIPQTHQSSEEFKIIDESSGLELQAISWAPDSTKSIAVINNRICREKETVSGFVIQQINPDDVIVSNGAITGKLVLRIR